MHTAAPGYAERWAPSAGGSQAGFAPATPAGHGAWRETVARGWLERCTKMSVLSESSLSQDLTLSKASKSLHYINFEPFLVIWTESPYWLLATEKPAWILGKNLFFSLLQQRLAVPEKQPLGWLKHQGWRQFPPTSTESRFTCSQMPWDSPPRGDESILSVWYPPLLAEDNFWGAPPAGGGMAVGKPCLWESWGRVCWNPHTLRTRFPFWGAIARDKQ